MTELNFPQSATMHPVADEIYRLLDDLAELIQQVEAHHARAPSTHLQALIKVYETKTRNIMDAIGAALSRFTETEPPPEVLEQVRAMVSARMRAWSRTSPLFHHIFSTPRHKLGAYEIYELLLAKRTGGADVAGQMLDQYYMNTVTADALRLRNELLTRQLAAEITQRAETRQPVRLLNLHTGSGHELQTLISEYALKPVIHVTCLDTDASAMRRVKQQLAPLLERNARFQYGDPREIVRSRAWPDAPYDLIYALVLFDQLSDRQVAPLIAGAYRGLQPGGKLIFGNYALSMPVHEHALVDWVMNINLRRRSKETLREIFKRTPFEAQAVTCELGPLGASWLVTAERT